MIDIDDLATSFIDESPFVDSHSQMVKPFMNAYEDSALQPVVNAEEEDFFETQAVERAFISLRSDRRYSRYAQDEITGMYELVRRYIHLMGFAYKPSKTYFRIDDMSSRSIEVRFSQRADISLNLFVGVEGESDYEEAYISYMEGGQSILTNDTMDRMVVLLKKLIGE